MSYVRDSILRAAQEEGIDPSTALAIAERESSFDPNAHASKTIHGLYQMSGELRHNYGIGNSNDPYIQAKGWMRFFKDTKAQMAARMGRQPTDSEAYLGHYFGSGRGATTLSMAPNTPVNQVFTPYELSINPNIGRAGNVGRLTSSITADIDRRRAKFGGQSMEPAEPLDFSSSSDAAEPLDFSSSSDAGPMAQSGATAQPGTPPAAPEPLDFSATSDAA